MREEKDGMDWKQQESSTMPGTVWHSKLEQELNPAQLRFATAGESSLLGLAGPGSGKTRALVYRAAHLIKSGFKPEQLMLLTFTNKAAAEMKDRLEKLLGFLPYGLWAGTFHSMGARILRKHADLAGRSANFTILDEDDSRGFLKRILSAKVADEDRKILLKRGFIGRVISHARNSGLTVRNIMEEYYPYRLEYQELIEEVSLLYEERKRESNAFDFDDLLLSWLDLFENNPAIAAQYRRRFKHVLVDEFQDTNIVQARIIDQFTGAASICVVGDDAQSIYAFRYADVGNILAFPDKSDNCLLVRMEQNYRSTPEILDLANSSIGNNRNQLPKKLYSENPPGEKPVLTCAYDSRREAAFVVQSIYDLLYNGVPLDEIAVLYRSSYLAGDLEFALAGEGINYRTYGGVKFFQKAHIKDVLAYLKVINNPADEHSWRRIATLQQGLGPATVDKIWGILSVEIDPLAAALQGVQVPDRSRTGWEALCFTLRALSTADQNNLPALLSTVLKTNYNQILQRAYPEQYEERIAGIDRLARYAEDFSGLGPFLESLTLEESVFAGSAEESPLKGGSLTLSTIHSAKGKEWDAVFIIALNQGHFPSRQVQNGEYEEERRLFYVAATRARRYLYLTTYRSDYQSYGPASEGPSLFLRELDPECYRLVDLCAGF